MSPLVKSSAVSVLVCVSFISYLTSYTYI